MPPVPADTFVLFGAFLAAAGQASPWIVFLVTWLGNVASALGVYALARRYAPQLKASPLARWLLNPAQFEQIGRFYERWGAPAIMLSRFLPAFRAVVPPFAGMSGVPLRKVLLPMAAASAAWYGMLVVVGTIAGQNWERALEAVGRINGALLWVALAALGAVGAWWWKSRRERAT